MRRSLATVAATAVAAVLTLSLAACGEEEVAADPAPAAPPSTAPSTAPSAPASPTVAGPPCNLVSDAQLTTWAATSQAVTGPSDQGLRTVCGTRVDPDDSLALEWSFQEPDRSLAELVEEESDPGLAQQPLDLGGTEAVLMTGDVAGSRLARVVTVVKAGLLVVEARNSPLGEPRAEEQLVEIVTQVATAYAG